MTIKELKEIVDEAYKKGKECEVEFWINLDDGENILAENVDNLIKRNIDLEEINEEHQKINGNLQKRITELENILKGKSIHEMGTSNLYKEDKR